MNDTYLDLRTTVGAEVGLTLSHLVKLRRQGVVACHIHEVQAAPIPVHFLRLQLILQGTLHQTG